MSVISKLLMGAVVATVVGIIIYFTYMFFFSRSGIDVSSAEICVRNESDQTLVFVAAADNGAEFLELLSPQQQVCAPSPVRGDTGRVGAFESEDAVEGCSRRSKAGDIEVLKNYSGFDNCNWETR